MKPDWSGLLQETRNLRTTDLSPAVQEFWFTTIPTHFASVTDQLFDYEYGLRPYRRRNHKIVTADDVDCHVDDNGKVDKKQLVLETRLALRFGLSCMSVIDDNIRTSLQRTAIFTCSWHVRLASILSWKASAGSGGGDRKCRLLASQLLSNLITANRETAGQVLQELPFAPSAETISRRLISSCKLSTTKEETPDNQLMGGDDCTTDRSEIPEDDQDDSTPTWLDMILASSSSNQREVMGVVVAALHNGTTSLLSTPTPSPPPSSVNQISDDNLMTAKCWANQVSTNPVLVSTLLRHVLPATAILGNQWDSSVSEHQLQPKEEHDHQDGGTEWIVRFLALLCRLGQLPELYSSARGAITVTSGSTQNTCLSKVVPEQVVLLYCLEKAMDDYTSAQHHHHSAGPSNTTLIEQQHPLGGEGGANDIMESHRFLVSLVRALHDALPSTWSILTTTTNATATEMANTATSFLNHDQPHLQRAAMTSILQILADSLGIEQTGVTPRLRQELAGEPETGLLPCLCRDLALLYDVVSSRDQLYREQRQQDRQRAQEQPRHHTASAGAKLQLTSDEQLLLTLLVRCLGNFCFQCHANQDLMRLTLVPRVATTPDGNVGAADSTGTATTSNSDGRTALHVVMSCTSLGVACFTLREWAVIALRSMLQDNEGNQELAAQLEAQQPVQTAELDHMGIRVDMDSSGNVSVLPLPEQTDGETKPAPQNQNPH